MPTNVLPKLKSASSDLENEVAAIEQQLSIVREKRKAILSVIDMFDASPAATEAKDDLSDEETASPTVEEPEEKTEKATSAKKATKAKSTKRKKDGRTGNWQKYLLPAMKGYSLPDAVQLVLEQEPKKDFKIAEVMSALFKETMPKSQYLRARNRVSNILSAGARNGDWQRGDRSSYRSAR
ncbi:hypothetical protein S7335_1209 [Synechococcus sp. PCC 7335]|uniref:hypothetical protein n=1 Tax=Synechococcus sp. (strain ATCC 29403 / PCC 7335) TaxID=91464 RepID=UPI00017EB567|nr:hypothetical protein [Synechococcus sp. PCC 7335]EDX82505.1 hypothetical protein S7335_1209 [Synechococcus sp. PCC 7335]